MKQLSFELNANQTSNGLHVTQESTRHVGDPTCSNQVRNTSGPELQAQSSQWDLEKLVGVLIPSCKACRISCRVPVRYNKVVHRFMLFLVHQVDMLAKSLSNLGQAPPKKLGVILLHEVHCWAIKSDCSHWSVTWQRRQRLVGWAIASTLAAMASAGWETENAVPYRSKSADGWHR